MFRQEAVAAQRAKLTGNILISIPLAWQTVGYLLLLGLLAAVVFVCLATYARVEVVSGVVVPDAGVATIQPSRLGTVTRILVRDGQSVRAGERLAEIRSEEDGAGRLSVGDQVAASIAEQNANQVARAQAMRSSSAARLQQLEAQGAGLKAETDSIGLQIVLQRDLISSAESELERVRPVAEKGFINGRDLRAREESLLSRRQQLAQLEQSLASRRAAMLEVQRSTDDVAAQARAQIADAGVARAQLTEQAANAAGARSYSLRAPVAGRITALTVRRGQVAQPGAGLMAIIPAGSRLNAELDLPTTAIGFVRPGQIVRLAVDAFPYQRFGVVGGRIETVAETSVAKAGANNAGAPTYPVTVRLDQTAVTAFGRAQPLVPGMTLTARIITEKQTLLEWLFEPLLAVRRR